MTRLYLLLDYNGVHIKSTAEATIYYFNKGAQRNLEKNKMIYMVCRDE